jgi:hypothetical protein
MAGITLTDFLGRRMDILGRFPAFPLGTTGATTVLTIPNVNVGSNKAVITGLNFDTYTSNSTVFTAQAGQSGATTDWLSSGAITPNFGSGNLFLMAQTSNTYVPGTAFQVNVTVAGTAASTCLVTVLGFVE